MTFIERLKNPAFALMIMAFVAVIFLAIGLMWGISHNKHTANKAIKLYNWLLEEVRDKESQCVCPEIASEFEYVFFTEDFLEEDIPDLEQAPS